MTTAPRDDDPDLESIRMSLMRDPAKGSFLLAWIVFGPLILFLLALLILGDWDVPR